MGFVSSGTSTFRTSKGNDNWFEKSSGSRNQGWNCSVRLWEGNDFWFELWGSSKKIRDRDNQDSVALFWLLVTDFVNFAGVHRVLFFLLYLIKERSLIQVFIFVAHARILRFVCIICTLLSRFVYFGIHNLCYSPQLCLLELFLFCTVGFRFHV